jgi:PAS domain S-box-containing protein
MEMEIDGDVEISRIERVRKYLALDINFSKELQDITALASGICQTPISLVTLLDENVNWIKASTGVDLTSSPRETSFCQYAIKKDELFIVEDASLDHRFDSNPLVHEQPGVRFYAGAPLVTNDGFRLGTLCVFDIVPNTLNELQKKTLQVLSRQVIFMLEAELGKVKLKEQLDEIIQKNDSLRAIAQMQSHDIRMPLTSIMGLMSLIDQGIMKLDIEWLGMLRDAATVLDSKIHSIVNESMGNKDIKLIRFNKMVEEIEDYAIILLSKDGTVENWNNGAKKIKGYNTEEIVGGNFSLFYSDEQKLNGLPQQLLEKAGREGISRDEGLRVRKDGSTFLARIVITAIHDEEGEVIGFTKVTRDISEKL